MNFNVFGYVVQIRKEVALAVILLLTTLIGLVGYKINKNNMPVIIDKSQSSVDTDNTVTSNITSNTISVNNVNITIEQTEIKVYIIGCVNKPGVVTLIKGQLIIDAINAAGGATEDADLKSVNLVYKLKDNVMLRIKSIEEASVIASEAGTGVQIIGDSAGTVMFAIEEGIAGGLININSATDKELDTLPGIGLSTAKDVINYREKNGPYKSINDIMKVSGIKDSRFEKIKDFITID